MDGLRGIAALGVAIVHAYPTHTFWVGWSLVDLFFVLSGFLIGSMLLDPDVSLPNFLVRRALRIWPVYYVTLALALVLSYLRISINPGLGGPDGVAQSLFFVQFVDLYGMTHAEMLEATRNYVLWFGHSWTLAVEQQFYVLLPLLLILFRPSGRTIVLSACLAIAGTLLVRSSDHFLGVLVTRADGLLLGVVLAVLFVRQRESGSRIPRWLWPLAAAGGLAMVMPYLADGFAGRISQGTWPSNPFVVLGYGLMYFALVGWVLAEPASRISGLLRNGVLVYLGAISYAIYMFHPLVQGLASLHVRGAPIAGQPWWVQLVMWVLIIGSAHLSKTFIEDRFNALKSRFPLYREAGEAPDPETLPSK